MNYLTDKEIADVLASPFDHDVEWPEGLSLSFSKMSCFTKCPRNYKAVYIDKVKRPPSASLRHGTAVHKAMELALKGVSFSDIPDLKRKDFDYNYSAVADALVYLLERQKKTNPKFTGAHIEEKWACRLNYSKSDYFSGPIFIRGKADLVYSTEDTLNVIDFKTGEGRFLDPRQLEIMALLAITQGIVNPEIKKAKLSFMLLDKSICIDDRKEIADIKHRAVAWQKAGIEIMQCHERDEFICKPSFNSCMFCPIKDTCESSHKRSKK